MPERQFPEDNRATKYNCLKNPTDRNRARQFYSRFLLEDEIGQAVAIGVKGEGRVARIRATRGVR